MARVTRVKFQWAAARATPGDWYFGLVGLFEQKGRRSKGLAISVRGLLAWGAVFAAIMYCAAAGYVWWKLEQRRYNYVTYADMLLWPVRRQHVDELRGQAMLAESADDLREQKWSDGLMKLRIGLEKYPRDNTARLTLARFFIGARLRTKAQETLMRALDFGWPGRAYLKNAIELAQNGEDYELIIEICDRAAPLFDPAIHPKADIDWLVEQRARATLAAGQHEALLDYIGKNRESLGDDNAAELHVLALIETKRLAEAETVANDWKKHTTEKARATRLIARIQREAGQKAELAASIEELRRMAPADPRLLTFAIVQTYLAGDDAAATRLLDDYVFRFGGSLSNFIMLAQPLAEIGRLAPLDRLLAAANDRGMRGGQLGLIRLQALFETERWAEAQSDAAQLLTIVPASNPQAGETVRYFSLLAGAATDPSEAAQSSFISNLRKLQLTLRAYRQAIEILLKADRIETARQVIVFAEGIFPDNAYLARNRVELDERIAAKRAAEAPAAPVADPALADSATFLAAIAAAEQSGDATSGLRLVRAARRTQPAWLDSNREVVDRSELRLIARGTDVVALQAAARAYLTNDDSRIAQVIALARESHGSDRKADARILLDEILRIAPDHGVTQRLRASWFPPEKPAAPATP